MEEHFPPKFTVLFLTWPQFYDTDFAILYGPSRMNVRGSTSTTPPLAPPSLFSRNIGFQCWNKKPGQNGQNRTITALSSTTLLSFFFKLYFVRSISTFSAPVLFSTKNVRKIEIAQVKMAPTFYLSFRVIRSLLKQNLWEGITCQLYFLKNIFDVLSRQKKPRKRRLDKTNFQWISLSWTANCRRQTSMYKAITGFKMLTKVGSSSKTW